MLAARPRGDVEEEKSTMDGGGYIGAGGSGDWRGYAEVASWADESVR